MYGVNDSSAVDMYTNTYSALTVGILLDYLSDGEYVTQNVKS